jgi:hypothetical protein
MASASRRQGIVLKARETRARHADDPPIGHSRWKFQVPVGLRGVAVVRRDGAPRQRGTDTAKSKGRASAKPRSGTKSRSKVKRAKPVLHSKARRSIQADGGAGSVEPAERDDHHSCHGGDQLAGVFGARLPGRGGGQEAGADAALREDEKTDGERVYRVTGKPDAGAEPQAA